MLVRLAMLVAGVCVVANSTCYAQCLVTSCNDSSNEQEADSCHYGKPAAPGNGEKACIHPPLSTGDWQKITSDEPSNGILELFCSAPISHSIVHPHESTFAGSADLPPPSTFAVASTVILRI